MKIQTSRCYLKNFFQISKLWRFGGTFSATKKTQINRLESSGKRIYNTKINRSWLKFCEWSIEANRSSIEVDQRSIEANRRSIEVDRISIEVNRISIEVDRISIEVDRISIEVDRISIEVDRISIEDDRIMIESNRIYIFFRFDCSSIDRQ